MRPSRPLHFAQTDDEIDACGVETRTGPVLSKHPYNCRVSIDPPELLTKEPCIFSFNLAKCTMFYQYLFLLCVSSFYLILRRISRRCTRSNTEDGGNLCGKDFLN